jgi:hypothetical protein
VSGNRMIGHSRPRIKRRFLTLTEWDAIAVDFRVSVAALHRICHALTYTRAGDVRPKWNAYRQRIESQDSWLACAAADQLRIEDQGAHAAFRLPDKPPPGEADPLRVAHGWPSCDGKRKLSRSEWAEVGTDVKLCRRTMTQLGMNLQTTFTKVECSGWFRLVTTLDNLKAGLEGLASRQHPEWVEVARVFYGEEPVPVSSLDERVGVADVHGMIKVERCGLRYPAPEPDHPPWPIRPITIAEALDRLRAIYRSDGEVGFMADWYRAGEIRAIGRRLNFYLGQQAMVDVWYAFLGRRPSGVRYRAACLLENRWNGIGSEAEGYWYS